MISVEVTATESSLKVECEGQRAPGNEKQKL